MITRVQGTYDRLDSRAYRQLLDDIRDELSRAAFSEITTPIIEQLDLFRRSLGLHTDVVGKEMYLVTTAHETDAPSLCLRPEGTAAVMRAFLNSAQQLSTPWRAFMIGPFFRHERPQKGRYRQFEQATIEVIGAESVMYDAQLIMLLNRLFSARLQLKGYRLLLNYMGCQADGARYRTEALMSFLREHRSVICATCQQRAETNPMRIFDCKQEACQKIYAAAPRITDFLCEGCEGEWQLLRTTLTAFDVPFIETASLVRGLDYYGKTVFEFVSDQLGAQSTFCGGGRYDRLSLELGAAEAIPSIGAGLGIERLLMLCEQREGASSDAVGPVMVVPISAEDRQYALQVALQLQEAGIATDIALESQSVKKQFRHADRLASRFVVVVGETERASNTVAIKDMASGATTTCAQAELIATLTMQLRAS